MRPSIKAGDPAVLMEFDRLNEAIKTAIWVILAYIVVWHLFGWAVITGALYLQPMEPELAARHFTYVANAGFLTVSHYANAGFSLSSSSVFYWKDNPAAYLAGSALVVAGNTMVAVYLRTIVATVRDVRRWLGWDIASYQYILDHPRRVTTHIFSHEQTVFLAYASTGLFVVNFVFFLASSLTRHEVLNAYGSQATLAGMGFYQVVATRSAGTQILDMRTLNQVYQTLSPNCDDIMNGSANQFYPLLYHRACFWCSC
jgi:Trk-type K+ transport system membrane component